MCILYDQIYPYAITFIEIFKPQVYENYSLIILLMSKAGGKYD